MAANEANGGGQSPWTHWVFDDQQRLAQSRVGVIALHTAGNGEEPAIQLRTCLLIGLQQQPRRRRP
jgi:hypothetical protein